MFKIELMQFLAGLGNFACSFRGKSFSKEALLREVSTESALGTELLFAWRTWLFGDNEPGSSPSIFFSDVEAFVVGLITDVAASMSYIDPATTAAADPFRNVSIAFC